MKKTNNLLFAFLLTIPVWILFIAYFLNSDHKIATGFFQNDNVSYIAYAKEYLDYDKFSIFYSNPFNDSGNYPKIYFQLQNFIYLFLLKAGIPGGYILLFFTLLCSFLTFRLIIAIYDTLAPEGKNRALVILLFSWGGGLLALCGIPAQTIIKADGLDAWDKLFVLDPGWGWWGLNLGRSLLFSAEAYYHMLFLAGFFFVLKKRWWYAFFSGLILFLSHPFTGFEFLLIICSWAGFEYLFKKNKTIPIGFTLGMLVLLFLHIYYYAFFLNKFPEHQSVYKQYSLAWNLKYFNILPAYCIVGIFTFFSLPRFRHLPAYFSSPLNRLLVFWFIISTLLANHELFTAPRQPIHFARGYIWSSLFIMGLPALESFLNFLRKKKYSFFLGAIVLLLFLSDNLLWIINYCRPANKTNYSVYITKEENNVIAWLSKNTDKRTLIISDNYAISYLSSVESSAYSWMSHVFTTPFYTQKVKSYNDFILSGKMDPLWYDRKLVFVLDQNSPAELKRSLELPFVPQSFIRIANYMVIVGQYSLK